MTFIHLLNSSNSEFDSGKQRWRHRVGPKRISHLFFLFRSSTGTSTSNPEPQTNSRRTTNGKSRWWYQGPDPRDPSKTLSYCTRITPIVISRPEKYNPATSERHNVPALFDTGSEKSITSVQSLGAYGLSGQIEWHRPRRLLDKFRTGDGPTKIYTLGKERIPVTGTAVVQFAIGNPGEEETVEERFLVTRGSRGETPRHHFIIGENFMREHRIAVFPEEMDLENRRPGNDEVPVAQQDEEIQEDEDGSESPNDYMEYPPHTEFT